MESVELALEAFLQGHGLTDSVRYYRLYHPNHPPPALQPGTGRHYNLLPEEPRRLLSQAAAVIYWGDFFHMWQYHDAVANLLTARGIAPSKERALETVREAFLLEGSDERDLSKVLSFGSTLLFNTLEDERREGYGAALKRFLKHSGAVWFRDVYSAFKASQLRESFTQSHLCTDCAALLPRMPRQRCADHPSLGIFLGRSENHLAEMVDFASALAQRLRLQPVWQPWGDRAAFPALQMAQRSSEVRQLPEFSDAPSPGFAHASSILLQHDCVVTDTYHICVNAWSQGLPAVCIAAPPPDGTRNVNSGLAFAARDKRHTFYAMYDALDFYVVRADLTHPESRARRIEHIARLVEDSNATGSVTERIARHASASADAFWRALRRLI
jgi:hypothetical protein